MEEIKYHYKPNFLVFLLGIIFFGVSTFIIAREALTNDHGLIIYRVIELSASEATILLWFLTLLALVFTSAAFLAIFSGISTRRELVLTETHILIPKSAVSSKNVIIQYSDIKEIKVESAAGQIFLSVVLDKSKKSIPKSMLPEKDAFENIRAFLESRISGSSKVD